MYGDSLVEQHANTKRFEVGNHDNRIVVAEHSIDVAAKRFTQVRHDFEAGFTIAVGAPAIVIPRVMTTDRRAPSFACRLR